MLPFTYRKIFSTTATTTTITTTTAADAVVVSLQCFDTVDLAAGRASGLYKPGCWFVGGDDLTGAIFACIIAPADTTTSIIPIKYSMETFWYRLTQVHPENDRQNEEIERAAAAAAAAATTTRPTHNVV